MPCQKVHESEYTVRAHNRTIHTRKYKLICDNY